jgi:hypothetical protein
MPDPFAFLQTIGTDLGAILSGQWKPGMPAPTSPTSLPASTASTGGPVGPGGAYPIAAAPAETHAGWQLLWTSEQTDDATLDFSRGDSYLLELVANQDVPQSALGDVVSTLEQHYPELMVSADAAGPILNIRMAAAPGSQGQGAAARGGGPSIRDIIALLTALFAFLRGIGAGAGVAAGLFIAWKLFTSPAFGQLAGGVGQLGMAAGQAAATLQGQGPGGSALLLGGLLLALYLVTSRR